MSESIFPKERLLDVGIWILWQRGRMGYVGVTAEASEEEFRCYDRETYLDIAGLYR